MRCDHSRGARTPDDYGRSTTGIGVSRFGRQGIAGRLGFSRDADQNDKGGTMATNSVDRRSADFVEVEGKDYVAETELKAGTVGLTGAIMQNITHIAPAIAGFFFTSTLVGFAGAQAPLAYLIGFIVVLPLGVCLGELAKKFPSAGGYFTYVSRTLGPRWGFLTGWMFVLYSPVVAGPLLAFLGFILEGELQPLPGWGWFHWWEVVVVGLPLLTWVGYVGMAISIRAIVIVGAAEFLIV